MRKDIPFYNYQGPPLATPTTQHHRIMGYMLFNENAWLDFRYYTFFAYVLHLFEYQFTLELSKWPYFNYIKLVYSFLSTPLLLLSYFWSKFLQILIFPIEIETKISKLVTYSMRTQKWHVWSRKDMPFLGPHTIYFRIFWISLKSDLLIKI